MNAKKISRNLSGMAIVLVFACIPCLQSAPIAPAATITAEVRPASQWTSSDPTGDEWPMYGGQLNHTGVSKTTPVSYENAFWTVTLPGYGINPVISGGRVYMGCSDGFVYCLYENNGSIKWHFPQVTPMTDFAYYATVAGGSVFVASEDNHVYCLNAETGVLNWTFTGTRHILSAPAVSEGYVYFGMGYGSGTNMLLCLNATTGENVWSHTASTLVSSPAIVGNRVYAGMDTNLTCFDAITGSYVWNFTAGTIIATSPVVANGYVYVGGMDYNMYCRNANTNAFVWTHSLGDLPSTPAVLGGRLFVGTFDHHVYCLDSITGDQQWRYTTDGPVTHAPSIGGGYVYVACDDNKLYCLNATTGTLYWRCDLGAISVSDPALANGKVFMTTSDKWVWCLPMIFLLSAPTLNLVTPSTTGSPQVSLSWTTNRGASLYYLYRDTSPITSIGSLVPIASPTGDSYTDTLTQSGDYYYALVAANGAGNSTLSNYVGVSYTQATTPAIAGPPLFLVMCIIALAIAGIKMRARRKLTTC